MIKKTIVIVLFAPLVAFLIDVVTGLTELNLLITLPISNYLMVYQGVEWVHAYTITWNSAMAGIILLYIEPVFRRFVKYIKNI